MKMFLRWLVISAAVFLIMVVGSIGIRCISEGNDLQKAIGCFIIAIISFGSGFVCCRYHD